MNLRRLLAVPGRWLCRHLFCRIGKHSWRPTRVLGLEVCSHCNDARMVVKGGGEA